MASFTSFKRYILNPESKTVIYEILLLNSSYRKANEISRHAVPMSKLGAVGASLTVKIIHLMKISHTR